MKFTDGFWQLRPGVDALYAQEAYDIWPGDNSITVTAPTKAIERRGDTLNRPTLTVTLTSPLPGIIGVRVEHFQGGSDELEFELEGAEPGHGEVSISAEGGTITSGDIAATVSPGTPWNLSFTSNGRTLTSSKHKALAYLRVEPGAHVDSNPVRSARSRDDRERATTFLHEQLDLGVGELIYGLGERFGPFVKNGQSIDIWNADGGTSSELAYKNVPFYLSSRGYGVLVNHPGYVSFEVGSEAVERVQFSVGGERLEYFVIAGDTPTEIIDRYTQLTGRPAVVPSWSYGLWLSTSFTTDYDEATVTSFIDAMAQRRVPLSVFHFDCFWMREFNWSDFEWDARTFPDPEGMLSRLHEKNLKVCVWINPYIAQRASIFHEAKEHGYLVKRPSGEVWQWDMWQAGMGLVDFTNPAAKSWYQDKLRALLDQGVDAFKTDFGERIPLDVEYFDGSSPERMHNWYTQLYNQAVFEVLEEKRGRGDAVLFARSATVGGQKLPVHWGGDSTSTYESMAETLRGGLSLAMSGFAYWSHDIGGFEGTPDAGVFKRWVAFGLLSSHSRLHGSSSYRVPWEFDDEAVDITRRFAELKMSLMPYLWAASREASTKGTPIMRPMHMEFPDDPSVAYLDRQYMLGPDLLVAPVFSESGVVDFYLPEGEWTSLLTGERVEGGRWRRETHGFDSLPLYVREGTILARGDRVDRPDYNYLDGLTLELYLGTSGGARDIVVHEAGGRSAEFSVVWSPESATVTSKHEGSWSVRWGEELVMSVGGRAEISRPTR